MNRIGNRNWFAGLATLALAFVSLGPSLSAQDQAPSSGPPARAVRLSFVDGQVKLSQGNQVLADQAVVNTPLFEGMQLTTADSGKPRLQAFCGSCASPIYSTTPGEGVQPSYMVRVGILRQRDQLVPRRQNWFRSARSWVLKLEAVPKNEKQAPA